jgi:hypothetical protein
VAVDT